MTPTQRLQSLSSADPGFYLLALFAYMEGRMRREVYSGQEMTFAEVCWEYYHDHKEALPLDRMLIKDLTSMFKKTNDVRHRFASRSSEEAKAGVRLTISFLEAHMEDQGELCQSLKEAIRTWDERQAPSDQELLALQKELQALQEQNLQLLQSQEKTAELERYLDYQSRFSLYTRSRRDYETQVVRLSPEQQQALDRIDFTKDFMIKGAAGSGKSLVLLKAIAQALELRDNSLDLAENSFTPYLITYSRTLQKYNQYLSRILTTQGLEESIFTADSYLLARLGELEPGWRASPFAVQDLLKGELAADWKAQGALWKDLGWNYSDLSAELEDFLWAGGINEKEYLQDMIPRKGRKQRINHQQRTKVWSLQDKIRSAFEASKTASYGYLRMHLSVLLTDAEPLSESPLFFLDETQDLTPTALRCFRLLTQRPLIMAADDGQAIFQSGSPYTRAGIYLSGKSAVLKTSFRNTRPILSLAKRLRQESEEGGLQAFREGPPPEWFIQEKGNSTVLVQKVQQILDHLGYEPEHIGIFTPTKRDSETIQKRLTKEGLETALLREQDFDFEESKGIRIATLDRSKGLDFPVVLLYLPRWNRPRAYAQDIALAMDRNLLYVGITRAMDYLGIFVSPDDGVLGELAALKKSNN
jgi:hypothetical protein